VEISIPKIELHVIFIGPLIKRFALKLGAIVYSDDFRKAVSERQTLFFVGVRTWIPAF
jgi:hypothetical protein